MKEEDQPLQCRVEHRHLVIRIGVATLAWAAKKKNGGPLPNNWSIEDKFQWASDVARAIDHEDEVGNSMLTDMLDKAMTDAANRGSTGLRFPRERKRTTAAAGKEKA